MAKKQRKATKHAPTQPFDLTVEARLEFVIPENFPARFANHAIVQISDKECYISFFEAKPPLILGPPKQREAEAKGLTSVRATCVSQVIMNMETVKRFSAVLQGLVERTSQKTTTPDNT